MLRKLSFIIAIFGISVLIVLLVLPAQEIENLESIEESTVNERVFLEGVVESELEFGDLRVLRLEGFDVDVVCDCLESYLGGEIGIEGVVSEFNGKKQVRALRINILK